MDLALTAISGISVSIFCVNIIYKTLYTTADKSINLITSITTKPQYCFKEIDDLIEKTDLICKINKIKHIITYIKSEHEIIKDCIIDLTDHLEKLNILLESIKNKKEYQESLYLGEWGFRSPNCEELIKKLEISNSILNTRFEYFLHCVQLLNAINTLDIQEEYNKSCIKYPLK